MTFICLQKPDCWYKLAQKADAPASKAPQAMATADMAIAHKRD